MPIIMNAPVSSYGAISEAVFMNRYGMEAIITKAVITIGVLVASTALSILV